MPIVNEPRLNIRKQPPIRIQGLWPSRSTALCKARVDSAAAFQELDHAAREENQEDDVLRI